MGNSVTSIGSGAFGSCAALNITIPNSVTNIGNYAFTGCRYLTGVYFRGNAPSIGLTTFLGSGNAIVYYLPGTTGWGNFAQLSGLQTRLWLPQMKTTDTSFGVRTNQFGFNVNWASGMTVVVEACASLSDPSWSPLQTNFLTSDSVYFNDPDWTNYPGRFYRLRSP
jgi:hypothetical protein